MIFVSLADDGPTLREHLGDFAFYLGFYTRQSAERARAARPAALAGAGQLEDRLRELRRRHVPHAAHAPQRGRHRAVPRAEGATSARRASLYFAGAGGGTTYKLPPGDFRERMRYVGYPDEMIERAARVVVAASRWRWSATTASWSRRRRCSRTSASCTTGRRSTTPARSCRSSRSASGSRCRRPRPRCCRGSPSTATRPTAFKRDSYRAYLMCFGSSGMFEQDDVENWVSITKVSQGTMARRLRLNTPDGADRRTTRRSTSRCPASPGPGAARVGYSEFNQRDWLTMWSSHLAGGAVERTHPLGRRRDAATSRRCRSTTRATSRPTASSSRRRRSSTPATGPAGSTC